MPVSAEMKEHLASNVTFLVPLWKMTALDGLVAAYAGHTRQLVYDGVAYKVEAVDAARSVRKLGLEPNVSELTAPFDEIVVEAELHGGRWTHARIEKTWVNYKDLTMGGVYTEKGYAGKFHLDAQTRSFTVEFLSLASQFHQEIGDVTQPTDARVSIDELGIDPAPHTHARMVTAVTSRQQFTVNGTAQADNYFRYGLAELTSGDNDGLLMEIKSNVGNVITLQLSMPYDIAVGDTVTLVRGYDSTRDSAKVLGGDVMVNYKGFPDLPGLSKVLKFPE